MNNSKGCIPYVCTGSGHKRVCEEHDIILKGVNWVHIDKIGANGPEISQLGTQYKNEVILY